MHPLAIAAAACVLWAAWAVLARRQPEIVPPARMDPQFSMCHGARWDTLTANRGEMEAAPITTAEFEEMYSWDLSSIPERVKVKVR